MRITKEKFLAIVCLLVAGIVLGNVSIPSVKAVEPVPPEEQASSYRMGAGSVKPHLGPEERFTRGRDPFQAKDPWSESAPALLAVPPARAWPRAFSHVDSPQGKAPLLLDRDPKPEGK